MKRNNRIEELAELIDKRGKLTIDQIINHFPNVSHMTLRRDLFQLEEEGKIIRIHGGAVSVKELHQSTEVPSYAKKSSLHTDQKIEIAQKAACLVDEGATIFLDGGTTALYLAKELPDIKCTVFTNGIMVANELAQKKNINVNLLGGELLKDNLSTASPLAAIYFKDMNFQLAVLSASAFTLETGFSCSSQVLADLFKLICSKVQFVYMLLDSSKIGKIMPYTFARLDDINVLVTDSDFPETLKEKLKEKNLVVL